MTEKKKRGRPPKQQRVRPPRSKRSGVDIEFLRTELLRREDIIRDKDKVVKKLRQEGSLFSQMDKVISKQRPLTTYVPALRKHIRKGKTKEAVGMLLSDLHGDQEVVPERVMGYEAYDFDEYCVRAQRLIDAAVNFCFENMAMHTFEDIHIFGLGDYVSGEIHNMKQHSKWQNAIKNSMGVGEVMGMMFQDLSKYFKRIFFYSVPGNHGRRTQKKDYHGAHDNWDYLVAKWAATRCQNLIDSKRLIVQLPDSFSHIVKIYGFNFFMNHGDDMKSTLGTPYYGMDRTTKNIQSIAAIKQECMNYFLYAHWHKMAGSQITTGEWMVNGAFRATDEYILHNRGGYGEPLQKIFGIHPRYGKTWVLDVNLREKGSCPKRRYICTQV